MFVIPTAHPAYVLRGARPITDIITADIEKAWRIAQEGAPRYRSNIICCLPQSPGGLERAVETALGWLRFAKEHKIPTAVDVETSSLDFFNCRLYSIAFGWAEPYNTAISFTLCDYHTIQLQYEQALIYATQEVLADPDIQKIFHNAPFDSSVLHFKGFKLDGKIMDTQGLAHLYQPDMPKSLDWIGHTWLDVRPWKLSHKGDKLIHTKDPWELLYYNGEDALNTALLVEPMIADLYEHQANPHLIDVQMEYARLAGDMEIAGLPVDMAKRREMGKELLVRIAKAKHKMREFLGWPDFNPMSDKQRRDVLFGPKYATDPWKLGLQATILTEKTRMPSTGYRSIIDHMEHPFVMWLADYIESRHTYATQFRESHDAERRKLKELGLDEELADFNRSPPKNERGGSYQRAIHSDGRLHYKCNPTGQKGTRFSTSPNVQNQKAKFRKFFAPRPGRVLVSSDLDQLELRITACLAGVDPLLKVMREPDGDPHMLACEKIYPNFWDRDEKERGQLRTYVKTVTYAALYMAQLLTVRSSIRERKDIDPAMRAAMTLPRVRHIYEGYFGLFPEIPRYHEGKMDRIKRDGFLACPPFDRKRFFPVYPPAFNEVANWDIQTCTISGTYVHTDEGLLTLDEIKQRHPAVMLADGSSASAVVVPRFESELLAINMSSGEAPLFVTPDHEFLVQGEDDWYYKTASELQSGNLICTPLSAVAKAFQEQPTRDHSCYWLGLMTSDACTRVEDAGLSIGTAKLQRPLDLAERFTSFAECCGWQPLKTRDAGPTLKHVPLSRHGRTKMLEDLESWGFDPHAYSVERRLPKAARQGGIVAARSFMLGMLEGDGCQGTRKRRGGQNNVYSLHMGNHRLLQDLLWLCRYIGIKARLHGPYNPGPSAEYTSWRLDLHGYDVDNVLFPERLRLRKRSRISRTLAPRRACEAACETLRPADMATASHRTLLKRLLSGGLTSAWTLREMYLGASCKPPVLYTATDVAMKAVGEPAPVFTMHVKHYLHQYLTHGLVSKNCGSEVVSYDMVKINYELKQRWPTAQMVLHMHDQYVLECDEGDANDIAIRADEIFGQYVLEGPKGPVKLTGESLIARDLYSVKSTKAGAWKPTA